MDFRSEFTLTDILKVFIKEIGLKKKDGGNCKTQGNKDEEKQENSWLQLTLMKIACSQQLSISANEGWRPDSYW